MRPAPHLLACFVAIAATAIAGEPVSDALTYQGRLTNAGEPLNEVVDFRIGFVQ